MRFGWVSGSQNSGRERDQRSEGLDELELPHGGHQSRGSAPKRRRFPMSRAAARAETPELSMSASRRCRRCRSLNAGSHWFPRSEPFDFAEKTGVADSDAPRRGDG